MAGRGVGAFGRFCQIVRRFSEVNNREHLQEQMLSMTIAEGVVRQKELLEDSSRLDKTAYKPVMPDQVRHDGRLQARL